MKPLNRAFERSAKGLAKQIFELGTQVGLRVAVFHDHRRVERDEKTERGIELEEWLR